MRVHDLVSTPGTRGPLRSIEVIAALLGLVSLSCSDRMDLATRPTAATEPASASTTVTAGDPNTQPGYYPLTVGNRWLYREDIVVLLAPDSAPPPPTQEFHNEFSRTITPPELYDGRWYLGELNEPQLYYLPIRQDVTGLYEWSPIFLGEPAAARPTARIAVPTGGSPARVAALQGAVRGLEDRIARVHAEIGAAPALNLPLPPTQTASEVVRLRYPLVPKATWRLREDRRFDARAVVIGQETLDLPLGRRVGHRIQVISDALGPRDFVTMWYGPAGFLQQVEHYEFDAIDPFGNFLKVRYDGRQQLTALELAPSGNPPPPPIWPPRRPK